MIAAKTIIIIWKILTVKNSIVKYAVFFEAVIKKVATAEAKAAIIAAFFFSIKAVRNIEIIKPPLKKSFSKKKKFKKTESRNINEE
jgi:hypothetical protein